MFSSDAPELPVSAQSGAGGTPWGAGAASAESCTHPAKRDCCFPPPIAERQRLPKVGIEPLGLNFGEILIESDIFSFKKMHLKMSSAKWWPFYLSLNVLKTPR